MGINLLKGMGKAYQAYKRNKASKKLFKDASGGMQHSVINKVKPKPTKGESTKVWGQKLRGKFKKKLEDSGESIDKVITSTNKLIQKVEGKPITKSGISKGKDL
mgnify:CR=1 FL=1